METEFKQRREKIIGEMQVAAAILFYSGKAPMRSVDEAYPFSVDRNFFYFTGIDQENVILLLTKNVKGQVKEVLFIDRYDEELAKWVGPVMKLEEAKGKSGMDTILYMDEFEDCLHNFIRSQRGEDTLTLALDLWKYEKDQADTWAHKQAIRLRSMYPEIQIQDIYGKCVAQRVIKSEYEIEQMKQAQKTTRLAIEGLLTYAKSGMNECELEGCFDFELMKAGANEHAFPSIIAGGDRATVLHYRDNNQVVEDGELVLLDLGSAHGHYCADISRTFPINGTFTTRQKELYNIVLGAQELVIQEAKPEKTLKDLQDIVVSYYETELAKAGLLGEGKSVSDYYYHGVSHHLGLDTHDICNEAANTLRAGMVITVEPGVYVEAEGIGIRIEDDIVITEDGAVNLSAEILKTPEDIEIIMQKNRL